MIDYHVHTALCRHASGEMEDYVIAAKRCGLDAMGFADHLPFDASYMKDLTMSRNDLADYIKIIPELEKRCGIKIYTGIEADYYPEKQEEIRKLIDQYSFDYVYGSVHFINGWGFDNPAFLTEWEKHDVDLVFKAY